MLNRENEQLRLTDRRDHPGTEGAKGVVRATGEGSGKVAVPLPEKKLNLGLKLKYTITIGGVFRAFFPVQFSWF